MNKQAIIKNKVYNINLMTQKTREVNSYFSIDSYKPGNVRLYRLVKIYSDNFGINPVSDFLTSSEFEQFLNGILSVLFKVL